jgi:hypothetical protein
LKIAIKELKIGYIECQKKHQSNVTRDAAVNKRLF